MIYKERMQKILDAVKERNLSTAHQRVMATLPLLEGEYMIKVAKSNKYMYYGEGNQYLGYLTFFVGLEFTRRREAARFKREELPEVIKRLNNLKGFKLIKIKK
jgi:hypothetical protein